MSKDFKAALKRVLKHEGGYVNDPRDTGGETNYGITKATARAYGYNGSMKDIPMDIVEFIYKKMFWDAMSCDSFDFALAFQLFDAAVNHGLLNARKIIQRAVGVKDDGMIGPVSLAAIRQQPAGRQPAQPAQRSCRRQPGLGQRQPDAVLCQPRRLPSSLALAPPSPAQRPQRGGFRGA